MKKDWARNRKLQEFVFRSNACRNGAFRGIVDWLRECPSGLLNEKGNSACDLRCCLVLSWLVWGGTLFADARLGSNIDEFRSLWGAPSSEETLVRTATLRWSRRTNSESIVPGVFAVEIAFLDGIACEIVLRSERRMTPHKLVELTKPFRRADFVKPQSEISKVETFKLSDGTLVWANKHEGHTVIVIKGPCYVRNEDVFDREAAKVRPPTSNH